MIMLTSNVYHMKHNMWKLIYMQNCYLCGVFCLSNLHWVTSLNLLWDSCSSSFSFRSALTCAMQKHIWITCMRAQSAPWDVYVWSLIHHFTLHTGIIIIIDLIIIIIILFYFYWCLCVVFSAQSCNASLADCIYF